MKGSPSLLLYRGQLCEGEMRRQRISADELKAAIRSAGRGNLDDVGAVVLETDGTFSVIGRDELPGGKPLEPLIERDDKHPRGLVARFHQRQSRDR